MDYIKSEKHFIDYFCKVINIYGIVYKNHKDFINILKQIWLISESTKSLIYTKNLVDIITIKLKSITNRNVLLDFINNELNIIINEALVILKGDLSAKFYYLVPIQNSKSYLYYKNTNIEKMRSNINEQAKLELAKLQNRFGIYFIYNYNNQLLYINKSKNLMDSVPIGLTAIGGTKFAYILTKNISDMLILKPYLISKFKPPLNNEFIEYGDTSFNFKYPKQSKIINFYKEK